MVVAHAHARRLKPCSLRGDIGVVAGAQRSGGAVDGARRAHAEQGLAVTDVGCEQGVVYQGNQQEGGAAGRDLPADVLFVGKVVKTPDGLALQQRVGWGVGVPGGLGRWQGLYEDGGSIKGRKQTLGGEESRGCICLCWAGEQQRTRPGLSLNAPATASPFPANQASRCPASAVLSNPEATSLGKAEPHRKGGIPCPPTCASATSKGC